MSTTLMSVAVAIRTRRFALQTSAVLLALVVGAPARAAEPIAPPAAAAAIPHRPEPPRVSRPQAVMLSLLLPGLGQSLSGHHGRAKLFYGAEAAVWSTSAGFRVLSHMRFNDVREYARLQAGADPGDQTDNYYQLLADYSSSEIYNIGIRDEARAIYPDDRDAQLAYVAEHSIQGVHGWQWPDFATRREFQLIRHDALSARRRAVLVTGWAVLNRLISAVEAAKSYPRHETTPARVSGGAPDGGADSAPRASRLNYEVQAGLTSQLGEPAAGIGIVHRF